MWALLVLDLGMREHLKAGMPLSQVVKRTVLSPGQGFQGVAQAVQPTDHRGTGGIRFACLPNHVSTNMELPKAVPLGQQKFSYIQRRCYTIHLPSFMFCVL